MSSVRVHNFSISLDGYGTGEGQSIDAPFGHAGMRLNQWAFGTRTFREMLAPGEGGGSFGVDEAFASNWAEGIGVEIMGRNKFSPYRGPIDDAWQGWWGENPPFHTPVIVLTHHPRPPLALEGGNTFYFVDADAATALAQARELAGDLDIRIGGGVDTVRQFLAADLIDRMHVVVVPIVLGRGENLWQGLEGIEDRFDIESTPSPRGVTHLTFTRKA